ncbi:MAG TPA: helix-turn-helix transcriptional regulator [Thermoanaerobaculia bacterium]
MTLFTGFGRALRWLRDRQNKRQYQVAEAAGITKAMLSAYETGKQKPSLDTLEKILTALECDLSDLHKALQIVNGQPETVSRSVMPREESLPSRREEEGEGDLDLYRVLGLNRQIPAEEERALSELLEGFHKMVRYLHSMAPQPPGSEAS